MELNIAAMVIASAAIHPFWNLLLKKEPDPQLGYLALTFVLWCCAAIQVLIGGANLWAALGVLPLIALSWCGQVLYGTCLTATLRRGDLSVYYPIIRASPIFIVIVGFLLLGRSYSPYVLAGILMAVGGGFLLLYRRGSNFFADPLTLTFALLSMSGTGIYSIADSQLVETLAREVLLLWVEGLLFPLYLGIFLRRRSHTRYEDNRSFVTRAAMLVIPGIMAYVSYYLILLAFKWGGEVAAVTAVRQASIPISVLLGGFFLREGAVLRRLMAAFLLAAGIVVIIVFG